jgi:hypothetical protein
MTRILDYLARNALAVFALACSLLALAGASYAAFSLPAGSVGTRQLRNGAVTGSKLANRSITPGKLDSRAIGGSVRHWAFVDANGTVIGGSRGARASAPTAVGQPYHISWGDQFPRSCAVLTSSPGIEGNGPIADKIGVHVNEPGTPRGTTVIWAFPSDGGSYVNTRFDVAVIC